MDNCVWKLHAQYFITWSLWKPNTTTLKGVIHHTGLIVPRNIPCAFYFLMEFCWNLVFNSKELTRWNILENRPKFWGIFRFDGFVLIWQLALNMVIIFLQVTTWLVSIKCLHLFPFLEYNLLIFNRTNLTKYKLSLSSTLEHVQVVHYKGLAPLIKVWWLFV